MKVIYLILVFLVVQIQAQETAETFRKGKKYGLKSKDGTIIVEPKYKSLTYLGKDRFQYEEKNIYTINKGLLDINGKELTDASFFDIESFNDNDVAVVHKYFSSDPNNINTTVDDYLYGAIDLEGNFLIDYKYEDLSDFNAENIAIFKRDQGLKSFYNGYAIAK